MIRIKIEIEKIFLALFFTVILFAGPGQLFDHKLTHDFPYGYFASDSFQHQIRAESIKDMGNFRYEASYISKGIEDAIGRYPPVLYHLAVLMSYSSGMETYDSIYFIVAFFSIIAAFIMYFIIRNYSQTAALLSLPMSLLIFSNGTITGFLWGHWPSLLAQSFLIAFFWSIMMIDLEKSFLIIASFASAIVMTHGSEAFFAIIVSCAFLFIRLITRKLGINEIKKTAYAFAIFAVVSFYFLIIFVNVWMKTQPYSFIIESVWNGNPGFYIGGFGILLLPMAIGILFFIFRIKDLNFGLILGICMLLGGFLNYIGFGLRSFQIRFFWPIYLSGLVGYGFYLIIKRISKENTKIISSLFFLIITFLFLGIIKIPIIKQTEIQSIPILPHSSINANQGIMDQYHWQSLKWISQNSEKDAKIYFFYGDIYSQDALLRNSKRVHYQVDTEDFIKSINEKKIKQVYITETPGDNGGGIVYRKSLFELPNKLNEFPPEYNLGPKDICNFNYYIFDKYASQMVLAQYNIILAEEMLKNDFMQAVFNNELVVILKNKKPGVDCVEERTF